MPFLAPLAIVIVTLLGWSGYQEYKDPIVGAVTPFTSKQLAADPSNGLVLKTNGSTNYWDTDNTGGGGLASSTPWTAGYLAYVVNNSTVRGVATTSLTASSPLSLSQPISVIGSSASAVSIQNAAADGSTKGAASFTANDFDASSGNISIDYTNAQKASGSLAGFLTSTDWNTFNNKLGSYDAWTHPATGQSATTSLMQLLGKASTTQLSANNAFFNFFQATSTTATSSIAGDFFVGASTGDNKVRITADRVFSASNSVGGLLNLTNTNNTGPALVLYTNNGGTSAGNLMNVRCDNTAMTHDCVKIDHDGAGDGLAIAATAAASNALSLSNTGVDHTLNASYTGSTAQKGAMNLTSTNTGGSVFQVTGRPSGLGVGKITHDSTGDANSSLLSLDASASGYLGQGIFLDSSGGSWGTGLKILNLRANGSERLTLTTDGLLTILSASTTGYHSFGTASSTLWYGGGLQACDPTTGKLIWSNGQFGCGTDQNTAGLSAYDAWTHPATGVSATTSSLRMAQASTTILSAHWLRVGTTASTTIDATGNVALPAAGTLTIPALTSALLLTDGNGLLAEYSGSSGVCTNQVPTSISAVGALGTCTSINNAWWSGTDLSVANGGTGVSTFGGTNTILYTTAADTLASEAAFTYNPSTDLFTSVNASTTIFSTSYASSTLGIMGRFGVASSSPWGLLSINPNGQAGPAFAIGSSTKTLFHVTNMGSVTGCETRPATSTTIVLNWPQLCNLVTLQMGTSAFSITLINATTSLNAGSRKIVEVCNPGSTAGAVTWAGVEWIGTAPTQTTTANYCDVYSFYVGSATSTTAFKVHGAASTGFQ